MNHSKKKYNKKNEIQKKMKFLDILQFRKYSIISSNS